MVDEVVYPGISVGEGRANGIPSSAEEGVE